LSIDRRNFLKSAAAAAVTIPAVKTVQASVTNSEILPADALILPASVPPASA
jgi:hypothetical protein